MKYIEFKNVSKFYEYENIKVLDNINFSIKKGEFTIISGPSSSGKTTILNLISSFVKPSSGDIIINEVKINELRKKDLEKFIREKIGFVQLESNLLENLNVIENILISKSLNKNSIDINLLLKKFNLLDKKEFSINSLSSSEKIKLMFIKAIVKNPEILILDEAFCLFDLKTTKQIIKYLNSLSKKEKTTVIIATTNNLLYPVANRIITLKNGTIFSIKENKKKIGIGELKC